MKEENSSAWKVKNAKNKVEYWTKSMTGGKKVEVGRLKGWGKLVKEIIRKDKKRKKRKRECEK